MSLLRNQQTIPEGGWVPDDIVRTRNPYDRLRWIYLFTCSTHGLKALRNALFTSKRKLKDANDVAISHHVLLNCCMRDEERNKRNHATKSDVKRSTINLNKWSTMNVAEAKVPFSWRTITEIADYLYKKLGFATLDGRHLEKYDAPIGYLSNLEKKLKQKYIESTPNDPTKSLMSEISSFEFCKCA